ncbi:unnamed protein product [Pleuronectes platessa]|uniref:Uncharacterized protein n=1 Tax=Pleuronectes platessa TaxID=8262 RepID=A0A9N7V2X4_PLEPL|nr:unnamed protein product [Pleuronectes platessa]
MKGHMEVCKRDMKGRQEVRPDSLRQSVDACQPPSRSVSRFDGWTLRLGVALHSEHTRIVFVPETFPLPDRGPRELGYEPHGSVTHRDKVNHTVIPPYSLGLCSYDGKKSNMEEIKGKPDTIACCLPPCKPEQPP